MTTLMLLYVIGGIVLVALSLPLLWEKVPPNPVYGFRLSATMNDPQVWYATNKYGTKRLMVTGISTVVAAAIFYFIPGITVDGYALACLFVFTLVFTIGVVQSLRYMRSIQQ